MDKGAATSAALQTVVMDDDSAGDGGVSRWISECHMALSAADALAARLARVPGASGSELALVRLRIAALRAEIERRREDLAVAVERRDLAPDWTNFPAMTSPWCPPESGNDAP